MSKKSITIKAIPMVQPMGEFFVGVMKFTDLTEISSSDMRTIDSDLDEYIGIQRILRTNRVRDLHNFVNTIDATFPTSIVLAVPGECVEYDENRNLLKIFSTENFEFGDLAKILDGQHRIEGLKGFKGNTFDISVTIFVEADISDQAFIFATVNLAQTKVNKSLVYDLLDYAKSRSPQKTCHDIAVALDSYEESPLEGMIKRLGTTTPGRTDETITQATFVDSLLPLISKDPVQDRNQMMKGKKIKPVSETELYKTPFRNLFLARQDDEIARIIINYFNAISSRWETAWRTREAGHILPRTNGFRALMRFLPFCYVDILDYREIGKVISEGEFLKIFEKVQLSNSDFTVENFPPGTSGQTKLFNMLSEYLKIDEDGAKLLF